MQIVRASVQSCSYLDRKMSHFLFAATTYTHVPLINKSYNYAEASCECGNTTRFGRKLIYNARIGIEWTRMGESVDSCVVR